MAENAPIMLKIGKEVPLMVFFKNQLDNGDLQGRSDPASARNVHFSVKKWCSKMKPF